NELFSVPVDGGTEPVKLNGSPAPGGDVLQFLMSPDGQRVVYLADQDANDVFELFSVPLGGGAAPIKVSGPTVSFDPRYQFQISADGRRAVYVADQRSGHYLELYSTPLDGGSLAVHLAGSAVQGFEITPDSRTVVYRADRNGRSELLCVSIDG